MLVHEYQNFLEPSAPEIPSPSLPPATAGF